MLPSRLLRSVTMLVLELCVYVSPLADTGYKVNRIMYTNDGLASNKINAVVKTGEGEIWIGTDSGLSRYDGYDYTMYRKVHGDSTSIKSNYIYEIIPDNDCRLWIKTDIGYVIYDLQSEAFVNDIHPVLKRYGIEGELNQLLCDADGSLWAFTSDRGGALYHLREPYAQAVRIESNSFPLANGRMRDFSRSARYIIGVSNDGHLVLVDKANDRVAAVVDTLCPYVENISDSDIKLYADSDSLVWIWAGEKIWIYDIRTQQLMPTAGLNIGIGGIVKSIVQDNEGRIWIAQDHKGITILEKNLLNAGFKIADKQVSDFKGNTVTCLHQDDRNIMWIGTYKKGLYNFSESTQKFDVNPVSDINVITPAGKYAWVGSDADGLYRWDYENNTLTHIEDPAERDDPHAIVAIADDGDGGAFIGTYGRGLKYYKNGRFHTFDRSHGIASSNVWSVLPQCDGRVWVGTLGAGLQLFDIKSGKVLKSYNRADSGLDDDYVTSLVYGRDSTLYIGTDNGVAIMTVSGDIRHIPGDSLSSGHINQIHYDTRGLLWIASRNGLDILDTSDGEIRNLSLGHYTYMPQVLGITADAEDNIWISVGNHLYHILVKDPKAREYDVHVYNDNDGLPLSDFNQRSLAVLGSHILGAGSADGISFMRREDALGNTQCPRVFFTKLLVNGRKVSPDENGRHSIIDRSMVYSPEVRLSHNDNNFTVYFSVDNHISIFRTRYEYRLVGLDKDWSPVPEYAHFVTYTNLPPGRYTLEVRAIAADGLESVEPATLDIVVAPPFWATVWAKILYALLAVAVFALLLWYMRRREKQMLERQRRQEETDKKEQLDQLKIKFFTNISHELRTPLTLILSPLDAMIKETDDDVNLNRLKLMHKNADHLLTLVNQLLDFRKSEMYGLHLSASHGDAVAFVRTVTDNLQSIADVRGINLSCESSLESFSFSFDNDKLGKIVGNLLSNALKYTPEGGSVHVTMSVEDGNFVIAVADTGIGISDADKAHIFDRFFQSESQDPSMMGTGIGLNMVREYTRLHDGEVSVEDNEPCGTRFIVRLPIKYDQKVMDDQQQQSADPVDDSRPVCLVVDDNHDLVDMLSDFLSKDFKVLSAENGKKALDVIVRNRPDIILTDEMMPEMTGIQLCRKIKSDKKTAAIPLMILTAKHDISARLEGLAIGADDYMTNPFINEELLLRLKKLVKLSAHGAKRQVLEPQPSDIVITSLDEKLVENAVRYVEDNLKRTDLTVEELSQKMNMSRVQFYKRITKITGRTPVEFIRVLRLKRASQLLRESQLNISEIAYETGFSSPKYFTKYFKDEFGVLPSVYQETYGK